MTRMTRTLSPADVRSFRKKHKLSQEALGDLLGLTRNTVARWEAGMRPVPAHMNLTLEGLALHLPPTRRRSPFLEPESRSPSAA